MESNTFKWAAQNANTKSPCGSLGTKTAERMVEIETRERRGFPLSVRDFRFIAIVETGYVCTAETLYVLPVYNFHGKRGCQHVEKTKEALGAL